ncbi:MAG: hypothetical protein KC620_17930, partial [Myxococcales bacterium]|nr:hypothetical protein [Myxococcales bacterium]
MVPRVDVGEIVGLGAAGDLLDIIEPSLHRIDAACPVYDRCPGCTVRHLAPRRRGALLMAAHAEVLRREAGVDVPWRLLVAPGGDGLRARAVARAMRDDAGRFVLAMGARVGEPIVLGECPVQTPLCRDLLTAAVRDLRRIDAQPYEPETRTGELRHVVVETALTPPLVVLAFGRPVHEARFDGVLADRPDVSVLYDTLPLRGAGTLRAPAARQGSASGWLNVDGDRLRATLPAWVP